MEEIAKTPKEIVCSMSEMQAHQILAVFNESDESRREDLILAMPKDQLKLLYDLCEAELRDRKAACK